MSEQRPEWTAVPVSGDLSPGFEQRVFARIARKKRQRKAVLTASLTFAGAGFLLFLSSLVGRIPPAQVQTAGTLPSPPVTEKVEVPVSEHLIFASDDGQTSYSIEGGPREERREF